MRPINPETGKPWPKVRPTDWATVRRVLKWRQADKKIRDAGFRRVPAFAALEWESPCRTHRIVDTAVHPDGMTLYVKLTPQSPYDRLDDRPQVE